MRLDDLGWSPIWQFHLDALERPGLFPGRIVRVDRGLVTLFTDRGERSATWRTPLPVAGGGEAGAPATGDFCALEEIDDATLLRALLPRQTLFARGHGEGRPEQPIAANIDVAFLVAGLDHDFNPRRLERYLALTRTAGAVPVIVLNKADLLEDPAPRLREAEAVARGVPVLLVSAQSGEGVEALRAEVGAGRSGVLLGSSGAGKSSLLNRLLGREAMATREVREDDSKGRHTTTARVLLPMPGGGVMIDTPGMREVGLLGDLEGLEETFDEITERAAGCRFADCGHRSEPGCAVRVAVEAGEIAADRLERFLALRHEAEVSERRASVHAQRHHEKTTIGRWRKQVQKLKDR
ncbi:MAG: ribosome small subunit-dependent GTPase A [Deltaproteobacteria bacterium]|nr:ribosome small subunit-dependent GTPase A [Deltaproteobacteria bacterium]